MDVRVKDEEVRFGPIEGKKGEKRALVREVSVPFRGTRLIAKESAGGMSTRLVGLLVNGVSQLPPGGGGTLSLFFAENALGNELKLDVCQAGNTIEMVVEFFEDCTWEATLEGRAALS